MCACHGVSFKALSLLTALSVHLYSQCVSEFISFITSEASDKCKKEKRKTINGEDILWAMSTLGFDEYIEPLKTYLGKYRQVCTRHVVHPCTSLG